MRTLIKNGTIVNADATTQADVLIDGEAIVMIGTDLEATADRTIDAAGKWVIPGGIDVHTHMPVTVYPPAGCRADGVGERLR